MVTSSTVYYKSPVGILTITGTETAVNVVAFTQIEGESDKNPPALLIRVQEQLTEYFAGKRREFHLPLEPLGTPWQQRVWQALLSIPYGETISYKETGTRAGNPAASRAVGGANNKNPIVIIIPCHRVIGANKALVGYGGGLNKKQLLLELERGNI